jgi:hypothetical protein
MDYTKNHHLPQWVKSDRIMMDDFNAAFANIDKGLSDRSQAVDNLSGQITSVSNTLSQQITDRALESTTFNRFCLAAYNHYHLAKLSDPFPRQMGVFHQSFTPENVTVPGMTRRGDCCYMGVGSKTVSKKQFFEGLIVESELNVTRNGAITPLSIRFTPTMPGLLHNLRIEGRCSTQYNNAQNGPSLATLTNLTTGQVEASFPMTLGLPKTLTLNVPFHAGYSYRLKIVPQTNDYDFHYLLFYDDQFSVDLLNLPSAEITWNLRDNDPCNGGIVLVQFIPYAQGGTLSLLWNNGAVPIYRTRRFTDEAGRAIQETEFRKQGAVPASNTLKLRLNCNTNGEIALYGWGGALI